MIAIARLIHRLGTAYLYHAEVNGLKRLLIEDLTRSDSAHPVIVGAARAPGELVRKRHSEYRAVILKRVA